MLRGPEALVIEFTGGRAVYWLAEIPLLVQADFFHGFFFLILYMFKRLERLWLSVLKLVWMHACSWYSILLGSAVTSDAVDLLEKNGFLWDAKGMRKVF